ncbi:MAG: DHH family phosphoesterase, partial [Symbiobacteriaceae bacterium]|nr:DHH family phosphoesterase [Symbiobacteriaceae bacterium]
MSQVWRLLTTLQAADQELAADLHQRNWLAAILRLRGLTTPEEAMKFLKPDLSDLPDPFLLPDMDAGVERLISAWQNRERIAIYGDYDADGVSATAVMVHGLIALGFPAPMTYIPDRFDEGYGLKVEALEYLVSEGAQLVVTVDCGISSVQEALFLRSLGIDLIITDHHQAEATLPQA